MMATMRGSFSCALCATGSASIRARHSNPRPRLECRMRAPRILFVKLSSLGDVIHHLPALTDVARRWPAAHIAWALDPAYAELVRLHPALHETIAVNLRSLRRGWFRAREWSAFRAARAQLRAAPWDYIVDTQGLV